MFEKLNNLEEGIIRGKEVEDLLKILASNYFDSTLKEDYLIVYNYRCFHQMYNSLIYTIIEKLDLTLNELEKGFNELWNEYKSGKEVNK